MGAPAAPQAPAGGHTKPLPGSGTPPLLALVGTFPHLFQTPPRSLQAKKLCHQKQSRALGMAHKRSGGDRFLFGTPGPALLPHLWRGYSKSLKSSWEVMFVSPRPKPNKRENYAKNYLDFLALFNFRPSECFRSLCQGLLDLYSIRRLYYISAPFSPKTFCPQKENHTQVFSTGRPSHK